MNNLVQFNEEHNCGTTTSLKIAEKFNRQHKTVLAAINDLEIPQEFIEQNFLPYSYIAKNGKANPAYEITFDGFTLLAMGFTGKKAMEFKVKYIKAFRAMEAELRKRQDKPVIVSEHTRALPSGKKEIVLSAKAREEIGGITKAVVGKALEGCKVIEYVNPIKNILSDDLLTETSLTPMEIENHIGHLLTGLWDYKKSSADMYKLYRLLEACKALACRYHSYANHLQGGVDFCEYYRGKNVKYFELNTDALYATVRGMLDTKIELSAL